MSPEHVSHFASMEQQKIQRAKELKVGKYGNPETRLEKHKLKCEMKIAAKLSMTNQEELAKD
jgi:hypothetical protein